MSMVGTVKFTEGLWTLLASEVQRQKVSSEEAVQPIALALLALRLLLQVFEAWIGKPLPHDMKALSASRSIAALPHEDGRCTRPAARASIHYWMERNPSAFLLFRAFTIDVGIEINTASAGKAPMKGYLVRIPKFLRQGVDKITISDINKGKGRRKVKIPISYSWGGSLINDITLHWDNGNLGKTGNYLYIQNVCHQYSTYTPKGRESK